MIELIDPQRDITTERNAASCSFEFIFYSRTKDLGYDRVANIVGSQTWDVCDVSWDSQSQVVAIARRCFVTEYSAERGSFCKQVPSYFETKSDRPKMCCEYYHVSTKNPRCIRRPCESSSFLGHEPSPDPGATQSSLATVLCEK